MVNACLDKNLPTGVSVYQCISELHKLHYLPPWPLALPGRTPHQGIMAPYFGWVPVRETRRGAEIIMQWKAAARAGTLFDCKDLMCQVIVHAIGDTQEDILAVCDVIRVQETVGAPDRCKAIAMFLPGKIDDAWIHAIIGYKYTSRRDRGLEDFKLTISGKRVTELGLILRTSEKALSKSDLQLDTTFPDPDVLLDSESTP